MKDMARLLEKWQLNVGDVREQMYRTPTPRERERWHGLWLLVQGWSVTQVAEALERDSHTIGDWLSVFAGPGPRVWSLNTLEVPPALNAGQQDQLKSAVLNPRQSRGGSTVRDGNQRRRGGGPRLGGKRSGVLRLDHRRTIRLLKAPAPTGGEGPDHGFSLSS